MAQGSSDGNIDVRQQERQNLQEWKNDFQRGGFQAIDEKEYVQLRRSTVSHQQILNFERVRTTDKHGETFDEHEESQEPLNEILQRSSMYPLLDEGLPCGLSVSLNLVLVGKMGNGKSSTGNTLLGNQDNRNNDIFEESDSVVQGTENSVLKFSSLGKIRLNVIDTPGLFDTTRKNEESLREISRCVIMSHEGVHAFLFVLNKHSRFTDEELRAIKELELHFGGNFLRYSMLVITHADKIVSGHKTVQTECKEMQEAGQKTKAFIESFGSNIIAVDNKSDIPSYKEKIREALVSIALSVSKNGTSFYRNELFDIAKNIKREIKLSELGCQIYQLMEDKLRNESLFIYNIDNKKVPMEFINSVQETLDFPFEREEITACTMDVMKREKKTFAAVFEATASFSDRWKHNFRQCLFL